VTREEALKNLRDEIDALRRSGDALRSRLEKLEPAPKPSGKPRKVAAAGSRSAAPGRPAVKAPATAKTRK
jgi:hypothetical protein